MKDYSDWLVGDNFRKEEEAWAAFNEGDGHRRFARHVNRLEPRSVLEFGCGTGWTASYINCNRYVGVDANPSCIAYAQRRCPDKKFVEREFRSYKLPTKPEVDVVLCVSFLKHFALHEWNMIFQKFLSYGRHAVFTMQIATEDKDDGVDWAHTWITEEHLADQLKTAGHELVDRELSSQNELGAEWIFVTQRG